MKKGILFTILLIFGCWNLLAEGIFEGKYQFTAKTRVGDKDYSVIIKLKPNLGKMLITATPEKIPGSNKPKLDLIILTNNIDPAYKTSANPITDINNMPSWIKDQLIVVNGEYIKRGDDNIKSLAQAAFSGYSQSEATMETNLYCVNPLEILVLHRITPSAGDKQYYSEYFRLTLRQNFFKNERAIYSSYFDAEQLAPGHNPQIKYETQCMSFMSLVLFYDNPDLRTIFNTAVDGWLKIKVKSPKDSQGVDKEALLKGWLDNSISDNSARRSEFIQAVNSFKRVFPQHFPYLIQKEVLTDKDGNSQENRGIYFEQYGKTGFESIYGDFSKAERNPYIEAYLLFMFIEGTNKTAQPIYSYLLWDFNRKMNYNSDQYQAVTKAEGESLAEAALKYLSWGVEYTPYGAKDSIALMNSRNPVYGFNVNNIKNWISITTNGVAKHNYFPDIGESAAEPAAQLKASSAPVIGKTHILMSDTVTDKLVLAGKFLTDQPHPVISRVDIWSSSNRAWETNVIKNVISSGQNSGNSSCLYDKRRSESFSLTIADASAPLEVGYGFNTKEKIGGLLIIGKYSGVFPQNSTPITISTVFGTKTTTLDSKKEILAGTNLSLGQDIHTEVNGSMLYDNTQGSPRAVDGRSNTRWQSNKKYEKVNLVLTLCKVGKEKEVGKVRIDWHTSYAKNYNIYGTNTLTAGQWGVPLKTISRPDGLPDHSGDEIYFEHNVKCRYLIFEFLGKTQGAEDYSIWEIEATNRFATEYDFDSTAKRIQRIDSPIKMTDNHIQYKYYVFNAPIAANEIKLMLKGISRTEIQELLVFPEDPIAYVTSLQSNTISLADIIKGYEKAIFNYDLLKEIIFNVDPDSGLNAQGSCIAQRDFQVTVSPNMGAQFQGAIKKGQIMEIWADKITDVDRVRCENGIEDISYSGQVDKDAANVKRYDNVFYSTINFKVKTRINTIVIWETGQSASSNFDNEVIQISGDNQFLKMALFSDAMQKIISCVKITSPYKDQNGRITIGNPLPYAPLGMDSPRTFAYKMHEQLRAIGKTNKTQKPSITVAGKQYSTTLAIDALGFENYKEVYVDEIDLHASVPGGRTITFNRDTLEYDNPPTTKPEYPENVGLEEKIIKPFLPGFTAPGKYGYKASTKSLFCPEKSAGVDSVGILAGAIGMTSLKERIVNLQNVPIGKLADQYFSMKPVIESVKPLDNQNYNVAVNIIDDFGKPNYYPATDGNVGSAENRVTKGDTHFRLTMKDIERMTAIVPDISMIRKGDLIVQYKRPEMGKEYELNGVDLGIVVGLGWDNEIEQPNYGDSAKQWWSQVYLAHVRQGLQQVTLGSWGNPAGMFGGFTENPASCQMRRLLKVKDGITALSARGDDTKNEWEIVKETLRSLSCQIDLPRNWDNEGTTNHWIPNTSGGLGGIKVILTGTNESKDSEDADPKGIELPLENYDIVILSPEDQFFSKANTDVAANQKNNTRTNKGTGIEIWIEGIDTSGEKIIVDGKTTEYLLATFKRKEYTAEELLDTNPKYGGDPEKLAKDFYRDLSYNSDFFDSSGKGKNGYRLHAADIQVTENGSSFRYANCLVFDGEFGGKKRLLYRIRIKVINDKHIYPGDDFLLRFQVHEINDALATAKEKDFLAIYDHKLLWRANLYLDEAINSNNQPTNRVDWNDLFPWDSLENLWNQEVENSNHGHVEGGQVVEIKPWSQCKAAWENLYKKWQCYNSVAYTGGAVDSVYNFNDDMDEQKACLNSSKTGGWISTLAPDNDWYQYDDTIRGTNCPYRPGYSITLGTGGSWAEADGKKSAGLDCGGFVVRCANYDNSIYMFKDQPGGAAETRYLYNDAIKSNPMYEQYRKFQFSWSVGQNGIGTPGGIPYSSWALDSANNYDGIGDTPPNPKRTPADFYFRYLVPGDIVLFRTQAGGNHIAIIHSITYDNGRTGKYDDVILIESTCYDKMYCVQKRNSIQRYINSPDMYSVWLRRIKIF